MGKSSKDKRDAYYRLAKEQGWRARSAFKLLQLDQEFNLFENVTRVVDLCAAPGSWSQVLSRVLVKGERIGRQEWEDRRYRGLVERRGEEGEEPSFGTETLSTDAMAADAPNASTTPGPAPSTITHQPPITPRPPIKIVALDLQPISPLEGITCLKADITHPSTIPLLLRALDPEEQRTPAPKVDLVLSDGAPDVTGLHDLDMYVQSQLVWAALSLALRVLRPGQGGSAGGTFVAKVFRVREVDLLFAQLRVAFDSVVVAKPRSSRASSGEAFVVCRGFRPPEGWSAGLEAPLGLPAEERGAEREGDRGAASSVTPATTTTTRRLREDGITELVLGTEDADTGVDGESEPQRQPGNRWIAPFLACGDLSAFDADASHKLPEGHVSLDPIQPPTAPPYRRALEERKKMGGAYGKTKLG